MYYVPLVNKCQAAFGFRLSLVVQCLYKKESPDGSGDPSGAGCFRASGELSAKKEKGAHHDQQHDATGNDSQERIPREEGILVPVVLVRHWDLPCW